MIYKKIALMIVLSFIFGVGTASANNDGNKCQIKVDETKSTNGEVTTSLNSADFEAFSDAWGLNVVREYSYFELSMDPVNKEVNNQAKLEVTLKNGDTVVATKTLSVNNPVRFEIDETVDAAYQVVAKISHGGGICPITNELTGWNYEFTVDGPVTYENFFYDEKVCSNLRNNILDTGNDDVKFADATVDKYADITNKNDVVNAAYLCSDKTAGTFGISYDSLIKHIKNAVDSISLAEHLEKISQSTSADKQYFTEEFFKANNYIKYEYNKNGIDVDTLSCKNYVGLNGQAGLTTGSPFEFQGDNPEDYDLDYYSSVNQGKFYTVGPEEEFKANGEVVCTTQCTEKVTISYGPPVASKAGLCFEYKVKVVAKSFCEAKINHDTKPEKEEVCLPVPRCNGTSLYGDQGGPSEDFDACIQENDNGEYTQTGIDRCFKEVYGKTQEDTERMAALTSDIGNAFGVSYDYLTINKNYFGTGKSEAWLEANDHKIIQAVRDINAEGDGGKYTRVSGEILWTDANGNKFSENQLQNNKYYHFGGYYFATTEKARQTIWNVADYDYKQWTYLGSSYFARPGGFKQTRNCKEKCVWTGCTNGEFINNSDAQEDYDKKLEAWTSAISKCTGEATCDVTTSTFDIDIDIEAHDNIDFEQSTIKPNDNTYPNLDNGGNAVNESNPDNTIMHNGACYGKDSTNNHYMTEWSFPGTWINNKTGVISYEDKTGDDAWHNVEDKFCLPLNAEDSNTTWWNWYIANKGQDNPNVPEDEKAEIEKDLDYNITAKTNNFGMFNWNIGVQCFYSANNEETCVDGDPECLSKLGEDAELTTHNVKYRAIPVNNFEDSNVRGWNWSLGATDLSNKDYPIVPTLLRQEIQDTGLDVYTDEYLDYEIILDSDAISKIREKYKDIPYNEYTGTYEEINDINFYRSDFLSDYVKTITRGTIGCNNQDNNGSCKIYNQSEVGGN